MRKKICAANWKMNKTSLEAIAFIEDFKKLLNFKTAVEVVIAPPFTSLEGASKSLKNSSIKLSSQNMHFEEKGAFTGEVSATMLKNVGCDYVILGHSERRHVFGETDDMIHKKIGQAIKHALSVIFCVGETLDEREHHKTFEVLERQLSLGLKGISKEALSQVVIAYEPVWAIGTGKIATQEQAQEAHKFIRKKVWDFYNMEVASQMSILYGGSVTAQNFSSVATQPNVDGALVGGASLEVKSFIEILKQMSYNFSGPS